MEAELRKFLQRMKRLRDLAHSGADKPEVAMAQRRLAKGLREAQITAEDLDALLLQVERVELTQYYTSALEKSLLLQIIGRTIGKHTFNTRSTQRGFTVVVTRDQADEIKREYAKYRALLGAEQKMLLKAFIHKHKLYPDESLEVSKTSPMSDAEKLRLAAMMAGLREPIPTPISPNKQITKGIDNE